jgi:HSP20 family protein
MVNENSKIENQNPVSQASEIEKDWVVPYADIFSSENGYHINLDMPGVQKEKLNLKVDSEELLVKGELQKNGIEDSEYYFDEMSYAGYQRTFILPKDIDPEKIEASYENGVLKLTLNKKEECKTKLIEIK